MAMGHSSLTSGCSDADKDYYNDLPGKVPPELGHVCLGPPPVPPLPTLVLPFTTLPAVQSPNLIDLNAEVGALDSCHHEYVNDSITKERDVFDMRKYYRFIETSFITSKMFISYKVVVNYRI